MDAAPPDDLDRFVRAQDRHDTYAGAVAELRRGAKTSHWMWFVFPQIAGLGRSSTARAYAIGSLAEARAYLSHPVLGPRLHECAAILVESPGRTAEQVFGAVDAVKLRSSMTLFSLATDEPDDFDHVLELFFGGERDALTLEIVRSP